MSKEPAQCQQQPWPLGSRAAMGRVRLWKEQHKWMKHHPVNLGKNIAAHAWVPHFCTTSYFPSLMQISLTEKVDRKHLSKKKHKRGDRQEQRKESAQNWPKQALRYHSSNRGASPLLSRNRNKSTYSINQWCLKSIIHSRLMELKSH